jgi:hypothetical protein
VDSDFLSEGNHILPVLKEWAAILHDFKLLYVDRSANQAAHLRAREAESVVSSI